MAVVERFKQESIYGCPPKMCNNCKELAVVERWPSVEVSTA